MKDKHAIKQWIHLAKMVETRETKIYWMKKAVEQLKERMALVQQMLVGACLTKHEEMECERR